MGVVTRKNRTYVHNTPPPTDTESYSSFLLMLIVAQRERTIFINARTSAWTENNHKQNILLRGRRPQSNVQLDGGELNGLRQCAWINRVDHVEDELVEEQPLSQRVCHLLLNSMVHHGIPLEE